MMNRALFLPFLLVVGLLLACVTFQAVGSTISAYDQAAVATYDFDMTCDPDTNMMSGYLRYEEEGTNDALPEGFAIYGEIPAISLTVGTTCADLDPDAFAQLPPPSNPVPIVQGYFNFLKPEEVDCSSFPIDGFCGGFIILAPTADQLVQCPTQQGFLLYLDTLYPDGGLDLLPYSDYPGYLVCLGDTEVINQVVVDIKPGSEPNSINCKDANRTIPVAILTTDGFDALTVDHTTVTFEGASESHVKNGQPERHEKDVDGDGDTDLLFHFRLGASSLTCDATEATLIGETFDGQAIEGIDSVRMVTK